MKEGTFKIAITRLNLMQAAVKEVKIVKARDTPDAACILLTVEVSSKK